MAAHLGKSVAEVETFTSLELSEWLAFARIEPLTDTWHQTGIVASQLTNLLSTSRKPATPEDFIPRKKPPRPPMTTAELRSVMADHAARISHYQGQL